MPTIRIWQSCNVQSSRHDGPAFAPIPGITGVSLAQPVHVCASTLRHWFPCKVKDGLMETMDDHLKMDKRLPFRSEQLSVARFAEGTELKVGDGSLEPFQMGFFFLV